MCADVIGHSMSDIETDQGSSSREALANAIASRLAANTRDISAEAQERANQEEKRVLSSRVIFCELESELEGLPH